MGSGVKRGWWLFRTLPLLMQALVVITLIGTSVLSIAMAAYAVPPSPAGKVNDHGAPFRDGNVLVSFDSGVSSQAQQRVEMAVQAHEVRKLGVGVHLLRVPSGHVLNTVRLLNSYPGVRYAEPDYLEQLAATPNDPSFPSQWGYQNTGQTVNGVAGTPGADEHAVPAWSVATGSSSIVIGEVDTGVDYTHPDLAANIWTNPGGIGGCGAGTHGYNAITSSCDPMDDDTVYGGHGTHVAGILGAVGNNGIGVTGVNWTTTILPVKWVSSSGSGVTSDLITSLDWLLKAKQAGVNVRVVNDSEVFKGTAYSQALSDEIDLLGQNGILFVTAAGNTSDNNDNPALRRYPCGYDKSNEICVAASNQNDSLPSWANYGSTTVDLAAPGDNIYSTLPNSSYGFISGSSMASPQVAGTAALILSLQDMSPSQLKADILENVDPLSSLSGLVRTGGRLDVCKALPGCAAPTNGTFGLTSVGANSDYMVANRKRVSHYQLFTAATVSKLTMYLAPTSTSGTQVLNGVIYADQGGSPGALLGVTGQLTFSSTNKANWYDLAFSNPVALQAGTYWIGVISGSSSKVTGFRWNSVSQSRAYNTNTYTNGPSNPFGSATIDSEQMSIYATYTAQPSTPPPPLPFSITPPSVSGAQSQPAHPSPEPQEGQVLTATTGTWDYSPTSYAYQWSRCDSTGANCTAIAGASGSTYMLVSADVGSTIRVAVTATNGNGSTTASSPPTMVVQAATPSNIFGKTTIGGSTDSAAANYERVDSFTLGQDASVSKLTIYLQRLQSGQQVLKGVIYADQGGSPGNLVAVSNEVTFGTSAVSGWYDLPFASPVSLQAGIYWIGLIDGATGGVFGLRYDDSTANSGAVAPASYTNGPLNPFGSTTLQYEQISIYASFVSATPTPTPTATPTPTPTPTATATPTPTPTPSGGGIVLRAAASANNGAGGSTLSITVPAGTSSGDVMLAQVVVQKAGNAIAAPAGWSLVLRQDTSSSIATATYVKVAGAAEPASYTWTFGTAGEASGGIASYIGVNTSTPIDARHAQYNSSTSNVDNSGVTTSTANDMLVYAVGIIVPTTVNVPTGFTEQWRAASNSATTSEMSQELFASTGATGTIHGTHNGGANSNITHLIALRPAGATSPPPPAGISLRAAAAANNGAGGSTLSITVPAGTSSGDVMLAQVVVRTAGNVITPPVGWSLVLRQDSGSSISTASYVKVAGASEPASYTWTFGTAGEASGGIASYIGVNTSTPIDASHAQYNASSSNVDNSGVTTTTANDMLVYAVGITVPTTVNVPSGFTEQWYTASNSSTTSEMSQEIFASVGATGTIHGTHNGGANSNITLLIALRPA
jgi:subtilisin family serine protease